MIGDTYFGWGKPGLKGWEAEIDRRMRVRGFGWKIKKWSCQGPVLVNKTWGDSVLGRKDLFGVG